MGFNVELNRDQKRLAEAKRRDLPTDHPLQARYHDWIMELDRLLGAHETENRQRQQGSRRPSIKQDTSGRQSEDKHSGVHRRAKDAGSLSSFHSVSTMSGLQQIAPARSNAPPVCTDLPKSRRARSIARSERERLLNENRMLQNMLARYCSQIVD